MRLRVIGCRPSTADTLLDAFDQGSLSRASVKAQNLPGRCVKSGGACADGKLVRVPMIDAASKTFDNDLELLLRRNDR